MTDYKIYCPDCGTKARYFTVWRAVTFYCTKCEAAKVVPLKALGRVGKQIQRAVDRGQLDLTVPSLKEAKEQALTEGV